MRRWFAACLQPCGRSPSGLEAGCEQVRGENPRAPRAGGCIVCCIVSVAVLTPAFSPSGRATQAQNLRSAKRESRIANRSQLSTLPLLRRREPIAPRLHLQHGAVAFHAQELHAGRFRQPRKLSGLSMMASVFLAGTILMPARKFSESSCPQIFLPNPRSTLC